MTNNDKEITAFIADMLNGWLKLHCPAIHGSSLPEREFISKAWRDEAKFELSVSEESIKWDKNLIIAVNERFNAFIEQLNNHTDGAIVLSHFEPCNLYSNTAAVAETILLDPATNFCIRVQHYMTNGVTWMYGISIHVGFQEFEKELSK